MNEATWSRVEGAADLPPLPNKSFYFPLREGVATGPVGTATTIQPVTGVQAVVIFQFGFGGVGCGSSIP